MKKVSLHTLGCKLNYAEGETLLRACEAQGYQIVNFDEPADLVLINTCSVTEQADKKCRYAINKARRSAPRATIAVMGCYAQLQPEAIAALPGVGHVVGTKEKFAFFSDLKRALQKPKLQVSSIAQAQRFYPAQSFRNRTRAFLKVQDGCDYSCSFCTIPRARGQSRSASLDSLCTEAQELAQKGVQEIVLSGVNIGDFSATGASNRKGLLTLLQALDQVPGPQRFRISSIEPNLLTEDIVAFVAEHRRWMPHFHVPLQSGSDKILGKMRRRYQRKHYAARVAHIKARMPEACIGVDVMVGFPGETENDFKETYSFLEDLDIQYLHVFPYAERPHTLAATMKEVVPIALRKQRAAQLRNLSLRKQMAFYRSQIGSTRLLLLEEEQQAGHRLGFTENYLRTGLPKRPALRTGNLYSVRLQKLHPEGFIEAELL